MSSQSHGPVVVGVDGVDLRVAEFGAREAERRRVPLHLLVAYEPFAAWLPTDVLAGGAGERDWATEIADQVGKQIADAHPGLAVTREVVAAHPAGALIAASAGATLVVVGTRTGAGFTGRLGGSVAEQVAAHAHAPVLVVRSGHRTLAQLATRPVVVGLDGSPESEQALAYAVDEAAARDVELRAVYAWSVADVEDIGPLRVDRHGPDAQDKATRLVAEATAGCTDRHPDLRITHRAVRNVDPVSALLDESADAGLLVLGARGRGGFPGLRLGSTVDGAIRHAACPVAVIHRDPS